MNTILRRLSAVFLLTYCAVVMGAQADAPVGAGKTRAKSAGTTGHSLFWEARKGKHILYLAGTIHLNHPSDDIPELFTHLYNKSPTVVFESDVWNVDAESIQAAAESNWVDDLSAETGALVDKYCQNSIMPCDTLMQLSPGFFCLTIEQLSWYEEGFDPERGIDVVYLKKSFDDEKTVLHLEDYQIPFSMLVDITDNMLDPLVKSCVESNIKGSEQYQQSVQLLHKLTDDFAASNARGLQQSFDKEMATIKTETPELYPYFQRIIARHSNWINPVKETAKQPGPVLILVGAAHILGKDSLVEQLQDEGYQLRPIRGVGRRGRLKYGRTPTKTPSKKSSTKSP